MGWLCVSECVKVAKPFFVQNVKISAIWQPIWNNLSSLSSYYKLFVQCALLTWLINISDPDLWVLKNFSSETCEYEWIKHICEDVNVRVRVCVLQSQTKNKLLDTYSPAHAVFTAISQSSIQRTQHAPLLRPQYGSQRGTNKCNLSPSGALSKEWE